MSRMCFLLVIGMAAGVAAVPAAMADETAQRVSALIRQLGDPSFERRDKAEKDLAALGASALSALREARQSTDPEVALRAARCIPQAEKVAEIASLEKKVRTEADPARRALAAHQLMAMDNLAGPRIAPILIKALEDSSPGGIIPLARALGDVGPPAKDVVPRFLAILRDSRASDDLRSAMADALAQIGDCEEEAVPVLLDLLQGYRLPLQRAAASALGHLGGKDEKVVPALIKALRDADSDVVWRAAVSLGTLKRDPDVCIPALMDTLRTWKKRPSERTNPAFGVLTAFSRYGFGANSAKAVPLICELIEERRFTDPLGRKAIKVLGSIGPAAKAAVPTLIKVKGEYGSSAERALFEITGIRPQP